MARQETNSITHLVKIVAREEAQEVVNERIAQMEANIEEELDQKAEKVREICHRAGQTWHRAEEVQLEHELDQAIRQIARNHQRSVMAICTRIHDKDLVNQVAHRR